MRKSLLAFAAIALLGATNAYASCNVPKIVGAFEGEFDALPDSAIRFTLLIHTPDDICANKAKGNYSAAQPTDDRGDGKGRYIKRQGCFDMRDEHLIRTATGVTEIEVHEFTACKVSGTGGDEFSIDAVFISRLDLDRSVLQAPTDNGSATLRRVPLP